MISFPNAKINIGLHVISKREDGYHNLNAFFVPINWNDILEIVPAENGQFSYMQTGIEVDCDVEDNLVVKAYRLLESEFSLPAVKIHLHKQLPFGAGLGGGSSDASATLVLLNKMFKLNLTDSQLEERALKLGADCPFFIKNEIAFVSGIGEELNSVKPRDNEKEYQIIICKPEIHISTQEAYSGVRISGSEIDPNVLTELPINKWKELLRNDFEDHLFERHPHLKNVKEKLYNKGALYASMTGSGSAIYGIFESTHLVDLSDIPNLAWEGEIKI